MNNPSKIKNWINFQRDILSLYRKRKINRNEYFTYLHLRLNCSPYGIAVTSISDINNDVFSGDVTDNYVNKLLLSLRSKKLIWYDNRQGSRGSFEVHFGDFIMPNEIIRTLDKYFNPETVISNNDTESPNKSEVRPEVDVFSHEFEKQKDKIISDFSSLLQPHQVRGYNTDTHTHKKKDNNTLNLSYDRLRAKPPFNKSEDRNLLTNSGFYPQNSDEERIWIIAQEIGEEDMKFLLSVLTKHGLSLIERAYERYNDLKAKETIDNPAAYLNKLIQGLIAENSGQK